MSIFANIGIPNHSLWGRRVRFLICLTLFSTARNPREAPGIRQLLEASDRQGTEQAKWAIERDPVLKEMDRLCRSEIPLPADFVLTRMGDLDDRTISISYYYGSKVPYAEARILWKDYFSKNGWNQKKEEDTFPHQELRFFNDTYEITFYYGNLSKRTQYGINCKRRS